MEVNLIIISSEAHTGIPLLFLDKHGTPWARTQLREEEHPFDVAMEVLESVADVDARYYGFHLIDAQRRDGKIVLIYSVVVPQQVKLKQGSWSKLNEEVFSDKVDRESKEVIIKAISKI